MIVAHVVEPFSSGVTSSIIHLCEGLPDLDHSVIHGTRTSQDNLDAVRSRFPIKTQFYLWKHSGREIALFTDLKATINLYKTLKILRPDVVHLHSSKAGVIGRLVTKLLKIQNVIYTPHSAPFLRTDVNKITLNFYVAIEKIMARLHGKIICCSNSENLAYKKLGISTTYINNGIKLNKTTDFSSKEDRTIRIGCAALITTQKNPALFNQIAEYFENKKRILFFWIGDGEQRNKLSSKNIEVTGWQDQISSQQMLSQLDIYLSSSSWEGLPYAVLEAMNYSTCLVLNNCVGNQDLVEEDFNGFLFSSANEAIDKINHLIDQPEKINSMGQASKIKCSREFDYRQMCEKYLKYYSNKTR